LILCGDAASDWSSGIVGPALAEQLELPQVTGVTRIEALAQDGQLSTILQLTRRLERGYRELVEAQLPLLITVTGDLNEPRYPSLPAHMAALAAAIPIIDPLSLDRTLGQDESDETTILEMHTPRPRPKRIAAPDSHHSAFERIGKIVSGGAIGRQTKLVEGSPEELAKTLVAFLREKGFL
jgi:electron transfer flavoprotein beta subunit